MIAKPTFIHLHGLARLARVHRAVPMRFCAEGVIQPAATLLLDNGKRQSLFDPAQAVEVIRHAVRSRLAPISPAELATALAAPIPGHPATALAPQGLTRRHTATFP